MINITCLHTHFRNEKAMPLIHGCGGCSLASAGLEPAALTTSDEQKAHGGDVMHHVVVRVDVI